MDLTKIKKQYRNQWVLIEYKDLDEQLRPKAGRVIAHAASKERIYKALLKTRGKNVSVEFCGDIDQDTVVMFCSNLHADPGRQSPRYTSGSKWNGRNKGH